MLEQSIMDRYSALAPLTEQDWALVTPLFRPKSFKKNEFFLRVDETPTSIAVVVAGLFRFYYVDGEGKEWVKSFEGPQGLLAAYAEILQERPSRTFIQALSDAEVLVAPAREFMRLTQGKLNWEMFLRKVAETFYLKKENREYEFLKYSALERWESFQREFCELAQEIPDYHIASYLGITPQSLSRLKKG